MRLGIVILRGFLAGEFMVFRVVQCVKCGLIQVTGAVKIFKCKKCGRSNQVSRSKVFFRHVNPLRARDACAMIKQEKEL